RLLQLKEYFEYPTTLVINDSSTSCDELLTDAEWKVLWNSVERKSLPEKIPTAAWAYKAIAKLGGWTDSKRTGKAAWSTIWKGWFRLQERVEGLRIANELMEM
ncbi:TPA: IS4 family transposase, partial [Legionella pneumophila subsp. pneumophila]|nr:IS4 family transposase [Legionella pneumophila subsp. pneumophila]